MKEVVVDDIKKEIIAFANCDGDKLYIGVRDDGTVLEWHGKHFRALPKSGGIPVLEVAEESMDCSQPLVPCTYANTALTFQICKEAL